MSLYIFNKCYQGGDFSEDKDVLTEPNYIFKLLIKVKLKFLLNIVTVSKDKIYISLATAFQHIFGKIFGSK